MVKRVRMRLVGLDGNAFNLLGHFQRQARCQGWSEGEVRAVFNEAVKGDYQHLLATLAEHIVDPDIGSGGEDGTEADEDAATRRG